MKNITSVYRKFKESYWHLGTSGNLSHVSIFVRKFLGSRLHSWRWTLPYVCGVLLWC